MNSVALKWGAQQSHMGAIFVCPRTFGHVGYRQSQSQCTVLHKHLFLVIVYNFTTKSCRILRIFLISNIFTSYNQWTLGFTVSFIVLWGECSVLSFLHLFTVQIMAAQWGVLCFITADFEWECSVCVYVCVRTGEEGVEHMRGAAARSLAAESICRTEVFCTACREDKWADCKPTQTQSLDACRVSIFTLNGTAPR